MFYSVMACASRSIVFIVFTLVCHCFYKFTACVQSLQIHFVRSQVYADVANEGLLAIERMKVGRVRRRNSPAQVSELIPGVSFISYFLWWYPLKLEEVFVFVTLFRCSAHY